MSITNDSWTQHIPGWVIIAAALFGANPGAAQNYPTYEAHTTYIGNYPSNLESDYSDETQGLAHDEDHWYIVTKSYIWRSPVSLPLTDIGFGAPGVESTAINTHWELWEPGYNHLGDPDLYAYVGSGGARDYLLVPIEGGSPGPGIAAFQATNLDMVAAIATLSEGGAPWCAVDPGGTLYATPFTDVGVIFAYSVDWDHLFEQDELLLTRAPGRDIYLRYENGAPLTLQDVQGGEFSASGEVLFMVCGTSDSDEWHESWGINVFDVTSGRRLEQSCNGCGRFDFEFHPGFSTYEEPEGVTVWDLDGGEAPNVSGQLHVVLVDNDWSPDDLYIKHYTHRQYLMPGADVQAANDAAWNGSALSFSGGNYPGPVVFDGHVRLEARNGVARIGE